MKKIGLTGIIGSGKTTAALYFKNLGIPIFIADDCAKELMIYDPILKNEVRKIQDSDSGIYGAKIASEVHKELRKYGGVKPPREFVLMDRAAIGLGSVFMHLKAEINWYRVFHELVGDFSEKNLKDRQNKVLKKVG